MKGLFYGLIALGLIGLALGISMLALWHFQGKAYAVIAVGAVCLIAGVIAMVVGSKPKAVAK